MCFGKHGYVCPFFGACVEVGYHLFEGGDVNVCNSLFERHWHRGVVYVLACEPEVYEFLVFAEVEFVEAFFQEVFDSFYVVVCYAFNFFYAFGIGKCEAFVYCTQSGKCGVVDIGELGQRNFAKSYEVLYFHSYSVAYEREFRKVVVKALAFAAVAAVDR